MFFQNVRLRFRTLKQKHLFEMVCSSKNGKKLSTGLVGLYTIFKVRPVDNFYEKIITGFHAVKRDIANLLFFQVCPIIP